MLKNLMVLKSSNTKEDARRAILHTDSGIRINDIKEIYYPYTSILFDLTVGEEGKFSRLTRSINCVVDMVVGRPAEGTGKAEYEAEDVDDYRLMEENIKIEEARQKGHDFALKMYLNKARLFYAPEIEIVEETFLQTLLHSKMLGCQFSGLLHHGRCTRL